MQSSEAISEALALVGPFVAGGANVAQGVAVRALGDLISECLIKKGHEDAWQEFKRDPGNDAQVRHLLGHEMAGDPGFYDSFNEALAAALREKTRNSGPQNIRFTGTGDAQIGDRGDMITGNAGSRVVTRGASYREGDQITNRNRVTSKKGNAGAIAILAIVALVIVVVLVVKGVAAVGKGMRDGGLTATSTCDQFLNTDEQTEQQALVDIAMSKGIGGFGSPLALPEIRYECSSAPALTLGAIIERDKGQY